MLTLCDSSLEYRADTNSINPVASGQVTIQRACIHGVSAVFGIIPTRSCQKFSKQICLWDLAQVIGILFIIQIVEAI